MNRHEFGRRTAVTGLFVSTLALAWGRPSVAWGGTYLTSAGLLVEAGQRESDSLRRRLGDKELAHLVHRLAESRLSAAREMLVPREVTKAHPHLLLVLESYERAADAALRRDGQAFLVAHNKGLEETNTLRAVLKQLGYELPTTKA